MLVGVWVFVFVLVKRGLLAPFDPCFVLFVVFRLVERGLLAPLITLYLIIRFPQPLAHFFDCPKKWGKNCTRSRAARRLCETRKASFKGCLWLSIVGVEGVCFFLTAIGVYAFLKLLAEVVMLLLFFSVIMLVGVWVFVFMLVERGLLAPLIMFYLIIR